MAFKSSPGDIKGPVHFRGISSGTIGGAGSYLGINDDDQVVLTTLVHGEAAGAVDSVANGANNRVATFSDSDSLNGEANLTFDGSQLVVSGQVSGSGKAIFVGQVQAVAGLETSGTILAHHSIESESNFSGSGKGVFVGGIETTGDIQSSGSLYARHNISGSGVGYFVGGIQAQGGIETSGTIVAEHQIETATDFSGSGKGIFVGGIESIGAIQASGTIYARHQIHTSDQFSGSGKGIFVGGVTTAGDVLSSGSIYATHNISGSGKGYFVGGIEATGEIETSGSILARHSIESESNFSGSGKGIFVAGIETAGNIQTSGTLFADIGSGTLAGAGSYIALNTQKELVLTTLVHGGSGGGAVDSVANGANNRVATFSDSDALNGEANLTFDGSQLNINGVVSGSGNAIFVGKVQAVGELETSGSILARHQIETDDHFSGSGKGIFVGGIETAGEIETSGSILARHQIETLDHFSGSGKGIFVGGIEAVGEIETSGSILARHQIETDDHFSGSGKGIFVGGVTTAGDVLVSGSVTCTDFTTSGADIVISGSLRLTGALQQSFETLEIAPHPVDHPEIETDCNAGNVFTVTLTGSGAQKRLYELANPENLRRGGTYRWIVKQGAEGGSDLLFGSSFQFKNGLPPAMVSSSEGVNVLEGVSDGTYVYLTSNTAMTGAYTSGSVASKVDGGPYLLDEIKKTVDLAYWFDAADIDTITKDGSDLVATWTDKSGYNRDAAQSNGTEKPTYHPDAMAAGQLPGITFNGSDNMMYIGGAGDDAPMENDHVTWFVVMKFDDANDGHVVGIGSTADGYLETFGTGIYTESGKVGVKSISSSTGVAIKTGHTYNDEATVIVRAQVRDKEHALFINGELEETSTAVSNAHTAYNHATIGGSDGDNDGSPVDFFDGTIGEIIIFSGAMLTDEQCRSIEKYLAVKWNATGTYRA
jgi:hypothetical protein